jgi:hypothetical protein
MLPFDGRVLTQESQQRVVKANRRGWWPCDGIFGGRGGRPEGGRR